jgi:hypothetical protein
MPFTPEREVNTARVQWAQLIPEIITVLTMGEEYTIKVVFRARAKSARGCHFVQHQSVLKENSEIDDD